MPSPLPVALLLLTVATAAPAQWQRVQQLPPDTPIAVLERGRTYPTPCHMDRSDDQTLTCIIASPYVTPRTLVFPKAAIAAVYTEELSDAPGPAPLLIGSVLGGGLGGALCNQSPAGTIVVCIALGAVVGAGTALSAPRYPRPPHIIRRRIYTNP